MKELDPGHEYLLDSYDGGESVRLVFMKREGEGYPFNVGHHPGTNCQEVIRALIARVKYVVHCSVLEYRAARRHGRLLYIPSEQPLEIEDFPTCAGCGHIGCQGNHKSHVAPVPDAGDDEGDAPTTVRVERERIRAGIERLRPFGSGDDCTCERCQTLNAVLMLIDNETDKGDRI